MIDIALLSETWLHSDNKKRSKIKDYHIESVERTNKKGGVAIFVNQSLTYRRRSDIELSFPLLELCAIEIKRLKRPLICLSLYRAPNSDSKEFNKEYCKLLNLIEAEKSKDLIIGTDHNFDFLKKDSHEPTRNFIEQNLEKEMYPIITNPTRITKSLATLIDNMIVSKNIFQYSSGAILIEDISDHLPCLLIVKNSQLKRKEPIVITSRKLTPKSLENIQSKLRNEDLLRDSDHSDVNSLFNTFHDRLTKIIDSVAPLEMYIPSKSKFRKEPWMLPNLLKCVRKQKLLYKKALQDNANVELWNKYKVYRNVLTGIKRRCKRDYYLQKCVEFKDNTKKLWRIINQMSGKLNDKSSIIDCIRVNDTLHYSPEKITNAFGNYFSTIGKKMASKIKKPKTEISKYISKINMNEKTMFWAPATKLEIVKLIDSLPNKRSSGFDNVDNKLLKAIKLEISEPLLSIFNQSLKLGVFPEKMKLAEVFPLHKSKERDLLSNYRLISLLITVSKLLEKLVYARTYNFLNETGQIFRSQYGFRNAHSCENAIQELFSTVLKGNKNKCYTMSIFLDLSKAFDTISHTVLFSKLNKYGLRGTCLDWYCSYLGNRKIQVKCVTSASGQFEYSDVYNIKFGTPQGSCLGPLIFRWFKFTLKPPYSGASERSLSAIWDTSHWNFFVKFGLRTA